MEGQSRETLLKAIDFLLDLDRDDLIYRKSTEHLYMFTRAVNGLARMLVQLDYPGHP